MKKYLLIATLFLSTSALAEVCHPAFVNVSCFQGTGRKAFNYSGVMVSNEENSPSVSGLVVLTRSEQNRRSLEYHAPQDRCRLYYLDSSKTFVRVDFNRIIPPQLNTHLLKSPANNLLFIPLRDQAVTVGACPEGSSTQKKDPTTLVRLWGGTKNSNNYWPGKFDSSLKVDDNGAFQFEQTNMGPRTHEVGFVTDERTERLLGSYTVSQRYKKSDGIKRGYFNYLDSSEGVFVAQPRNESLEDDSLKADDSLRVDSLGADASLREDGPQPAGNLGSLSDGAPRSDASTGETLDEQITRLTMEAIRVQFPDFLQSIKDQVLREIEEEQNLFIPHQDFGDLP